MQSYEGLIKNFLASEFPYELKGKRSKEDMVDLLTQVFVSTKENRIGPAPSPEVQVTIREIIRSVIGHDEPIPVLSKWGALKRSKFSHVDVADVMALRQFDRLNEAVKRFHEPGIRLALTAEDVGGYAIYGEDAEDAITYYHNNLQGIMHGLGVEKFATLRRESALMTADGKCIAEFLKEVEKNSVVFALYLTQLKAFGVRDLDASAKLAEIGWTGEITQEHAQFYYDSYKRNYPGISEGEMVDKLAIYFAQALGKYKYGIRGDFKEWHGKFIYLSLIPPIPHAPESLRRNTLYWRSLPATFSHINLAPWRAKGYLQIDNSNNVTPKVTTGYAALALDLKRCATEIGGVEVETDYMLV